MKDFFKFLLNASDDWLSKQIIRLRHFKSCRRRRMFIKGHTPITTYATTYAYFDIRNKTRRNYMKNPI